MAWLTGYSARKELSVSSIDYLTAFQKKIILHAHSGTDTEGADPVIHVPGCDAAFDDIRFTGSDGETLLDYYIESVSGEVATVWIEWNFVAGYTTIYLYWGNDSASAASSVSATFPVGDIFAGSSLNAAMWDTSGAGSETVSGGELTITGDEIVASDTKVGNNYAFRARVKSSLWNSNSGSQYIGFSYYSGADTTYTSQFAFASTTVGDERRIVQTANGFSNYTSQQIDAGDWAANTYGIVEVRRNGDHTELWINDTIQGDLGTDYYDSAHSLSAFFYASTGTITVDWCFIRQIADHEPTVTIAAEVHQKATTETITVSLTEAQVSDLSTTVTDDITVALTEAGEDGLHVVASDTALVTLSTESPGYAVAIGATDDITIDLDEDYVNDNPNTAADAVYRRFHGKVKISYTDPSLNEESTISSSSDTAYGTTYNALFDGMIGAPVKYMILDGSSPLDGTISVGDESVGWRSNNISDAAGAISAWIEISFPTPRTVHNLYLSGDDQWNNYPTAFNVHLHDSVGADLYNLDVTGNTTVNWTITPASPIESVKTIRYTISAISQPLKPVMITELYSTYSKEYLDDEILSISVLEEMEFSDGSVPLGNISSNECTVKLSNVDHQFSLGNPHSNIASLMLKNRRVDVWLGIEVPLGCATADITWKKRGVFWTQDWSVPEDELYAEITALDRLELLRTTEFYSQTLHTDKSIGYLLEEVLDDAGLVKDVDYWIHADLYAITIPYGYFGRTTHREAIRELAVAGEAKAYCDGDGMIIVEPWDPGTATRVRFTRDKFKKKDNPLAFGEVVNFVEVYANPRVIADSLENIYVDTEVISIAPGATETRMCVFNTDDPCTEIQSATFTQSALITLTDDITVNLNEETNIEIDAGDTKWLHRNDMIRVSLTDAVSKGEGLVPDFLFDEQQPEESPPPGAGVHINSQTDYNWGSEIEFHNAGAVTYEITSITIQGKPVSVKGRKLITAQDDDSIRAYGKMSLQSPVDNEFIQSEELAQDIADSLLAAYKTTRRDVTIDAFGYIDLEMGDKIQVVSYQNTELKDYAITSQELNYDHGVFRATYKARRI